MKNKMKKRCVKILTVFLCMMALVSSFVLSISAADVESEQTSSSADELSDLPALSPKYPIYRVDFLTSLTEGFTFNKKFSSIWEGYNWGIHFTWTPESRYCNAEDWGEDHPDFDESSGGFIGEKMTMGLVSKKAMPLASWVTKGKTLVLEFGMCDPVKTYSDPNFQVVFNETFGSHDGPSGLVEKLTSDNYYECRLIFRVVDGKLQCEVIYRCIEDIGGDWGSHLTTYTGHVDMTEKFFIYYVEQYQVDWNRTACKWLVDNGVIKESSPYIEAQQQHYYNKGFDDGELLGYANGLEDGNYYGYMDGYDVGWTEGDAHGRTDALNATNTFKDAIFSIFDAPVTLINGMLDFDLMGINVLSLCKTILTVAVIAAIVTVLIKFIL